MTAAALTVPAVMSNVAQVLAPSALVVTSLTAPTTLQRGQTFSVSVGVRNTGGAPANNVLPSPSPPSATTTGGVAVSLTSAPPTGITIAAGATGTFTYSFRESGGGAGDLRFTTGATGTDSGSGLAVSANATQSNQVTVVAPPQLVIDSVSAPSKISRGQAFQASVTVRNAGGAQASNVRPTLVIAGSGSAAASTATLPTAVTLAGAARATFTFDVVENGAGSGSVRLDASATGTNATTGAALTAPVNSGSSISVETAAALRISTFTHPVSISRGSTFAVSMTVLNTGQATATNVLPVPSPPTAVVGGSVQVATSTSVTAATLLGGAQQTFTWTYVESGTGAGSVAFNASARGIDDNSKTTVSAAASTTAPAQVLSPCNPAAYTGVSLDMVVAEFSTQVHPLMARGLSGCLGCHAVSSGRPFVVTVDPSETFHLARAGGFLKDAPGSVLNRLTSTDALAMMPKGQPAWTPEEIQRQADIVCKLKVVEASLPPADEQFPPNLLAPYSGPAVTYYDNTFLKLAQLRGKVKAVFADDWVRGGVDQFQANLGLFGGVDFQTRFVEARQPTAEFLVGLDKLAPDVCGPAATNRTGPFVAIDTASAISDAASSAGVDTVYRRMLYRPPTAADR
ncbi:MAG: hypothetical protein ACT4TC_07805, partial [Myxococcaceae bacterium]